MSEEKPVRPLPEPTDDLIQIKKEKNRVPRVMIDEETGDAVELTKKQTTFLRHVNEMGPSEASQFAKISRELGEFTMKLPAVQQYMKRVLWAAGATDELAAKRVAEGLSAMVAPKEFLTKKGKIVEGKEHIDFEQRGKYIDRYNRLVGNEKPPSEAPGGALPPGVNLAVLSVEDLKKLICALDKDRHEATDTTAEPA